MSERHIASLIENKQVHSILDLHEGYYYRYRKQQKCTVACNCPLGNTIYTSREAMKLDRDGEWRERILHAANSSIALEAESYVLLDYICRRRSGTLREFASLNQVPYILVEVAKGGTAEPYPVSLDARKQQISDVVKAALTSRLSSPHRSLLRR